MKTLKKVVLDKMRTRSIKRTYESLKRTVESFRGLDDIHYAVTSQELSRFYDLHKDVLL